MLDDKMVCKPHRESFQTSRDAQRGKPSYLASLFGGWLWDLQFATCSELRCWSGIRMMPTRNSGCKSN